MKISKGPYATWYDKVEGKTQNGMKKDLLKKVLDMFQMEL